MSTVTEGVLNNKSSSVMDDSSQKGRTNKLPNKCLVTGVNIKFIDKNDWKDSLNCCVCTRVFDKMKGVFTHHW